MKYIYLDVCALCRPYDDQSYARINLETIAVHLILKTLEAGRYTMISSPAHQVEISAISDDLERIDLLLLLEKMALQPSIDKKAARMRAEELVRQGLGPADAAHLAFAEASKADFISCDDKLIKKCFKANLTIWAGNPIAFCDKEDLK